MSHLDSNRNLSQSENRINTPLLSTPVYVEVVFGVAGKNCDGVGICKILPLEHVRVHWKCPSARAWLCAAPEGSISLVFDRSTLPPAFLDRYFLDQTFPVEEAYSLSNTLLSLLNMSAFTVKPGRYSVQVSECFLVICF